MADFSPDAAGPSDPGPGGASAPPAGRMILWQAPETGAGAVAEALSSRFTLDRPAGLAPADVQGGGPPVLALFRPPAERVLAALEAQGHGALSGAVEAWCAEAEALLALNRANRRRVRLMDTAAIAAAPQAFLERFGLPADPALAEALEALAPPPGDPVAALLVRHGLDSSPRARALCGALAAAAAPGGAAGAAEDPDAAFAAYRRLQEARDEAGRLRAGAARHRREAETRAAALAALEDERSRTRARLEAAAGLEQANRALSGEIEARKAEEERLHQRLGQLGQGLDSSQQELDGVRRQADLLKAQNRALQEELEALQASSRALAGAEDAAAALKSRVRAKDRALAAAGARLADLETRLELMAGQAAARKAAAARAAAEAAGRHQAELQEIRERAAALEAGMARLTQSKSFRLTAPLRRLRALFSGRGPA